MEFEEIRICNLFSYYKEQPFDLIAPEPGRNIVLISGRNGYGKTSFINSVKLLFGGVTDSMRSGLQVGRTPTHKQYVHGLGDDWLGIMNRRARAKGEKECWIQIRWKENFGTVTARRTWYIDKSNYKDNLDIETSFTEKIEDTQKFLNERLPPDYIPFFFFDGEQIRVIAEANRDRQTQHIEGILNISPLNNLMDSLKRVKSNLRRGEMEESAKAELARLEKEKAELEAKQAINYQEQEELKDEIEDIQRKIAEEDRYLENLRAYSPYRDKESLRREQRNLEEEIQKLQKKIAEYLPRDVPLLVNPILIEKASNEIRKLVDSQAGAQVHMLEILISELPHDLFDKPPYPRPELEENQITFYKDRLTKLLKAYIPDSKHISESLFHIEMKRAKELLQILESYLKTDIIRRQHIENLHSVSRKKRQFDDIEQRIDDLGTLSEEAREDYQIRKDANEDRKILLGGKLNQLSDSEKRNDKLTADIKKKEKEIKQQERKVDISKTTTKKLDMTKRIGSLCSNFKTELKGQYRKDIETKVNHYFQKLTSRTIVDSICIDEDFSLHYTNQNGQSVGMANLASGIKQLVATSLLWALKEVSQKPIPVVIDTPLARIDRKHQNNLLTRYYPNAGEQVIILPTDSELDKEKYKLLLPHIYREYRLENPDGESTEVVKDKIYK
ncbi:MAG: DNA sulfur modification protein DndD [Desulfobacteraceae bacterium]|nr:DNA sulfur modification protein DndD [Desulfobacteraceae bacterium]